MRILTRFRKTFVAHSNLMINSASIRDMISYLLHSRRPQTIDPQLMVSILLNYLIWIHCWSGCMVARRTHTCTHTHTGTSPPHTHTCKLERHCTNIASMSFASKFSQAFMHDCVSRASPRQYACKSVIKACPQRGWNNA